MYYRDHAPPHFHAIYGEHEAEYDISAVAPIAGQLPHRARRLVEEWAAQHQAELLVDWNLAILSQPLLPIDPLE
jgi:hypothetical protein